MYLSGWIRWFHLGIVYSVEKKGSALQMQISISCIHDNNKSRITSLLDSSAASIPHWKAIGHANPERKGEIINRKNQDKEMKAEEPPK